MSRIFLILLLFWSGLSTTRGQHLIRGTVRNAETNQPLEAVHIQLLGTYRGTITNMEGRFTLEIQHFPAMLRLRHIGYRSRTIRLNAPPDTTLDVRLTPVTYSLPPVVVGTGSDPAEEIMRRVIARKQTWRSRLHTYRAETYSRQTVATDTGIVQIAETHSLVFWKRDKGVREVVQARRQTANLSGAQNLVGARYLPNFYDDDLDIAGYRMIGPTHPKALRYYRFRLTGYRYLDDRLVYDIAVEPAARFQPLFRGKLAVLDSAYALLEVDLEPGEMVLFPPPFQEVRLHYRQQFSLFKDSVWLPVDVRVQGAFKIGFPGLQFPPFQVRQLTRFITYEVNVPLPDTLFQQTAEEILEASVARADTLTELARVPLTPPEQQAYAWIDSTQTLSSVLAPRGLLARFVRADSRRASSGSRPFRFTPRLWFNRVEGLHVGARLYLWPKGRLKPDVALGYAFASERPTYRLQLHARLHPRITLTPGLFDETIPRWPSIYGRLMVGMHMLMGGRDYLDYYRRQGFGLEAVYGTEHLHMRAGYFLERHRSDTLRTTRTLFGPRSQRPNLPVVEGRWQRLTVTVRIGDESLPAGLLGRRALELALEHGWQTDARYLRLGLLLDAYWSTFLRRRMMPPTLYVRLQVSTASGALPPQARRVLDGALGRFGPFGTLRTLQNAFLEGDHLLLLAWEHNFRSLPFELLGLRSLAQHGIEWMIGGTHGRIWHAAGTSRNYHELTIALNRLLGMFRLDLGVRLDRPGWGWGISYARVF
ncbi:DUF5686 and carboxypeptidase-like regulatory domain-containing protein [Rhodothermus profundi]|uniref:CarboxypepD_reg-like domain-containing protein n=1 Tax=Rhodothermus profundi TaxID=633813 RepID=A0A1M6X9R8_9BACT|nr:DUF5686 and carboxypeptidase-like regulatory domain-containing protein [Rhodothermus profundi]SHL02686.1 CarboxypepD_reg-like domain-containing protein [Rhodothermus profundi]